MVNTELINYIIKVRSQGYSDEQIKAHLIKHDYSQDVVDEAFLVLNIKKDIPVSEPKKKDNTKKRKKIVLELLALVFIILIIAAGYLFFKGGEDNYCENVSVSIHKIRNEDVLCVFPDNSKIMTIVKNSGQVIIRNLIFEIRGNSMTRIKLDNVNILPNDVSTHTLDYGKSDIRQIRIIPETSERICEGVVFTEIKTC
jgi:hypothetical protein